MRSLCLALALLAALALAGPAAAATNPATPSLGDLGKVGTVQFPTSCDPSTQKEFERADEFDIARRPPRSLSFGHGAHKCIGEHLARLEGRILLEEILALAPEYEVDARGVERTYGEFLHGYHAVPIEFDPRIPFPARRIGSAVLWSPDASEEAALRADWAELTGMIALGELDSLSARHGQCLQVRPKAANARSLTPAADGDGAPGRTLPRGFYLRARFTGSILRKCGLHTYNAR